MRPGAAVERAPGLLGDQEVHRLLIQFRDDVGPAWRRGEGGPADLRAPGRDAVGVDQHDRKPVPAEGRGQAGRPLDDVIEGRHPRPGGDPVLQVDHDQGRPGVQGGQGHRAPHPRGACCRRSRCHGWR